MKEQVKKGKILIAEPFMIDNHFRRAVILITENNQDGAIGYIINKSLNIDLANIIANFDFSNYADTSYFGGPVSQDNIYFLHSLGEELIPGSVKITDHIWWGGDYEQVKILAKNNLITSNDIRFYVGYSGWLPGQLEEEVDLGSWIISDMDANLLFKLPSDKVWSHALSVKGSTYKVIASIPDTINWN